MRTYLRSLLNTFPELARFSEGLYLRPSQPLLVGYTVDFPPSGARLFAVRLPLYESVSSFHLSYSAQIAKFTPNGELLGEAATSLDLSLLHRRRSKDDERAFAEKLANIIRAHREELHKMQDLRGFAAELSARLAAGTARERKTLGFTLIMLGELETAREILSSLIDAGGESEANDLKETTRTVALGWDQAITHRLNVVKTMRARFGIEE